MSDAPEVVTPSDDKPKKAPRAKKRMSDFEIARTILQRTCERKVPYVLRNMGETGEVIVLCSHPEADLQYGCSELTMGFIHCDDPQSQREMNDLLVKLKGWDSPNQMVINVKDQISLLGKTKGEEITDEIYQNEHGSCWIMRKTPKGEKPVYLSLAISSLYHYHMVQEWHSRYIKHLMSNHDDCWYHPFQYTDSATHSLVEVPVVDHPLQNVYPHGFRMAITKGIDVVMTSMIKEDFPYPIVSEEFIFFPLEGDTYQMAHRVIGTGWRALLVQPNAVHFPAR